MYVEMVRTKIHQARVTLADVEYVGSIGIDTDLIAESCLHPYEKVLVVNLENGSRLETYVIPAESGSREISLNGAAARMATPGDRIIIMSFVSVPYPPPEDWEPRVLIMDENNEVTEIRGPEQWDT